MRLVHSVEWEPGDTEEVYYDGKRYTLKWKNGASWVYNEDALVNMVARWHYVDGYDRPWDRTMRWLRGHLDQERLAVAVLENL